MADYRYDYWVKFHREHQFKRCAEIGVWDGAFGMNVLDTNPHIEEYHMVDPLSFEANHFAYTEEDRPQFMEAGKYVCNMGVSGADRPENLDRLAANIEDQCTKRKNLFFHRLPSVEGAKKFEDGSLDFLYLDALHLYQPVKDDIAAWWPKLKPGGIFGGDDHNSAFPGVIRACKEVFGERLINDWADQWYVTKD